MVGDEKVCPFWLSREKMTFDRAACYCRNAGGRLANVTSYNLDEIAQVMRSRGNYQQAWCSSWNNQQTQFLMVTRRGELISVNRADLNHGKNHYALCQNGVERIQIESRGRMKRNTERMNQRSNKNDPRQNRNPLHPHLPDCRCHPCCQRRIKREKCQKRPPTPSSPSPSPSPPPSPPTPPPPKRKTCKTIKKKKCSSKRTFSCSDSCSTFNGDGKRTKKEKCDCGCDEKEKKKNQKRKGGKRGREYKNSKKLKSHSKRIKKNTKFSTSINDKILDFPIDKNDEFQKISSLEITGPTFCSDYPSKKNDHEKKLGKQTRKGGIKARKSRQINKFHFKKRNHQTCFTCKKCKKHCKCKKDLKIKGKNEKNKRKYRSKTRRNDCKKKNRKQFPSYHSDSLKTYSVPLSDLTSTLDFSDQTNGSLTDN